MKKVKQFSNVRAMLLRAPLIAIVLLWIWSIFIPFQAGRAWGFRETHPDPSRGGVLVEYHEFGQWKIDAGRGVVELSWEYETWGYATDRVHAVPLVVEWFCKELDPYYLAGTSLSERFLPVEFNFSHSHPFSGPAPHFTIDRFHGVIIQDWFLLSLASIAPLIHRIRSRRVAERANSGLCPACSYDLRMHKPGDKCPECGTVIAGKSA